MRVEVLFDKQNKVSQPVMAALANELQKKICPQIPNMSFVLPAIAAHCYS